MNLIRIAGLASLGFAALVEPALAEWGVVAVHQGLLQGLVCQHSSLSAAHIG